LSDELGWQVIVEEVYAHGLPGPASRRVLS
jgi:hypothetical protein